MTAPQRSVKGPVVLSAAFLAIVLGWLAPLEGDPMKDGKHVSYLDVVAKPPVWTICLGVTGKDIVAGMEWNNGQCLERMRPMIQQFSDAIMTCIVVPIFAREHLAFLSLAWNIGTPAFCRSTVVKRVNRQDYVGACDAILVWKRAGGKDCSVKGGGCYGIWVRRKLEHNLCRGYLVVPGLF